MSRNERYRTDKRATLSLAKSNGSPRRELVNGVLIARKDRHHSESNWTDSALKAEEIEIRSRFKHSGCKELILDRRSKSNSRRSSSSSSSRYSSHRQRFKVSRRSRRSLSRRRGSPYYKRRSPYRTKKSPTTLHSRRRYSSPSNSPSANALRVRSSRSLSRSPISKHNHRVGIFSPPKRRGTRKHDRKQIRNSLTKKVRSLSVSKCLDSDCSVCKSVHEKSSEPLARPKSPKMKKPIHIYERSRSRSFSVPKFTPVVEESFTTMIPQEPISTKKKNMKKMKSHKKKKSHKSKSSQIEVAVIHQPIIQIESTSEEENCVGGSDMSMSYFGGTLSSLYERYSKIEQSGHDHELPQRRLHMAAGNNLRVGITSAPISVFRTIPVGTSYEDVKGRYAYYKYQGYLSDLTLADYIKWEEWWYKYQDQLAVDRTYCTYRQYIYR